jgi:hypothetical protein
VAHSLKHGHHYLDEMCHLDMAVVRVKVPIDTVSYICNTDIAMDIKLHCEAGCKDRQCVLLQTVDEKGRRRVEPVEVTYAAQVIWSEGNSDEQELDWIMGVHYFYKLDSLVISNPDTIKMFDAKRQTYGLVVCPNFKLISNFADERVQAHPDQMMYHLAASTLGCAQVFDTCRDYKASKQACELRAGSIFVRYQVKVAVCGATAVLSEDYSSRRKYEAMIAKRSYTD